MQKDNRNWKRGLRTLEAFALTKAEAEARIAKADPMPDLIMMTESKLDSIIADSDPKIPNINLTGYSLTR